jgi:hypothetical protein
MASKKPEPMKKTTEYQIITATGRCAHTFTNYDRALAYYKVVRYPGWKLVECVTCLHDITPPELVLSDESELIQVA